MNRGVSDRLVVFHDQIWFVEVKRPGGKLTKLQESFRQFIESLNLDYFLVNSIDQINIFLMKVEEASRDKSSKTKDI